VTTQISPFCSGSDDSGRIVGKPEVIRSVSASFVIRTEGLEPLGLAFQSSKEAFLDPCCTLSLFGIYALRERIRLAE
jgi:hypothetical protein